MLIIVQIILFPHLIKPNFEHLCHYCATKNGVFCTKNEVCKKNNLHTSLIFNYLH